MPTPSLAAPTPKEPWAWAEGGMISTAPDLERFMKALLGGRLLPPAQQRQLFVVPALSNEEKEPYSQGGLARYVLSDGTVVWGKTGSMAQYASGAFGTDHGRRVVTYSFLPDPAAPGPRSSRVSRASSKRPCDGDRDTGGGSLLSPGRLRPESAESCRNPSRRRGVTGIASPRRRYPGRRCEGPGRPAVGSRT